MTFATFLLPFLMIVWAAVIVFYILQSISHMKALKMLGYDKPWMAWIPYACWYACADAVTDGEEDTLVLGNFKVPAMLFKFWWVVSIIFSWTSLGSSAAASLVLLIFYAVFLGSTYSKMYARIEGRDESDTLVIGIVSGIVSIIAVIKFFMYQGSAAGPVTSAGSGDGTIVIDTDGKEL